MLLRPVHRRLSARPAVVVALVSTFAISTVFGTVIPTTPLSPTPASAAVASEVTASEGTPVQDPHGSTEPSGTTIREVGGTNVLYAYEKVVPSFDGWKRHEPTREYISLNRTWRFQYDPDNLGKDRKWFAPGFDDSSWSGIPVPSAWDLKDNDGWPGYDGADFGKGGSLKDGYAWYRTTVDVPSTWRGLYPRLNFLSVYYSADIWVNGNWVGKHEGGNTSFAVPLDKVLKPGSKATIALRVFRRADYTSYDGSGQPVVDNYALPATPVDLWPYAGITRAAWIEAVPRVSVAKLLLDTPSTSKLDARAVVENNSTRPWRGVVALSPGRGTGGKPVPVEVSVPAGGVAVAKASIPIPDAPAWSPSSPRVLTARATLAGSGSAKSGQQSADTLASTYGARTVSVNGPDLELNGEKVFLKGTNWHEETDHSGRAMKPEEYDKELARLNDLGANFLRNAVYSRHPYAYDWMDKNGVMSLDEWDTFWINTAQQEIQLKYGLSRMLAATTAWNNHNHPSVIMWGLQNESTADTPTYRAWLADMKDAVKTIDLADRPVTWASYTNRDQAFDLADVVGFNEYFGYFYGKNEDLGPALDETHRNHPDKPVLITENGSYGWPLGNRGDPTEQGTEDWQAAGFSSHWSQVRERPFTAGYTFWNFKDYKQRRNYNMNLNGMSGMGLIAWDGIYERYVYSVFAAAN